MGLFLDLNLRIDALYGVLALMRRAVSVSEDGSGFADDSAEDGVGVVFLAADPLDEDDAALGGKEDAELAACWMVERRVVMTLRRVSRSRRKG